MPATKKLVLRAGSLGSSLVLCHAELAPAAANSTWTVPFGPGGTLYRATSGLAVGLTTGSSPVTRESTWSVTTADWVSSAPKPSAAVTRMRYVPSCRGAQVKELSGL